MSSKLFDLMNDAARGNLDARGKRDTNFCTVIALSVLGGITPRESYALLENYGRKHGKGVNEGVILQILKNLGGITATRHETGFAAHKTTRKLAEIIPPRGAYLVVATKHVGAIRWGEFHDFSDEKLMRVKDVWKIEYPENSRNLIDKPVPALTIPKPIKL